MVVAGRQTGGGTVEERQRRKRDMLPAFIGGALRVFRVVHVVCVLASSDAFVSVYACTFAFVCVFCVCESE